MLSKTTGSNRHEYDRHEILRHNRITAPNPLTIFPSKRDTLTRAFFQTDVPKHIRKKEEKERWLDPEKITPDFGVKGNSEEVMIRRSYRRVGSSQVFAPVSRDNMPLSELYRKKRGTDKKFVLVEEERLSELTKFENILREEKERLGEQCAWVLSDIQTTARIPVPAIRLAMHNLCEAEQRKAASAATKLIATWNEYKRKNGYNKSMLYMSESVLKSAPVGERAAKMKQMKIANSEWLLRKNQDTMSFEDDLSRLNEKYLNAQTRRRDYDRYFVLATRYGVYTEEEFFKDSNPGDRYYKAVVRAAVMLQKLWAVYWPVKNMRMHRAARLFQTLFRAHVAYRMWHPIIRIRIKIGKRALFKHMWKRWSEYNHLCREIKAAIRFYQANWRQPCFLAWKEYTRMRKNRTSDLLNRFIRRMKNVQVATVYMRWVNFTKRSLKTKLFCRRLLSNPHFFFWVEYTKVRRHIKYLGKNATVVQSLIRRALAKKHYHLASEGVLTLQGFARIIFAKNEKRRRRDIVVKAEFDKWLPEEMETREKRANEKERRRLVWEQQLMQEKESMLVLDLKRHLRSKNGKYQLNLEADKIRAAGILDEQGNKISSVSRKEALKMAKSSLLSKCAEIGRCMGKHDFNAKSPPNYRCADNSCRATFVTPEQYHSHMIQSTCHAGKDPQYSKFHVSLKVSKFQETVGEYFTNKEGFSNIANCLDLWVSIQDWKKTPISTEVFVHKAVTIYETYLREGCTRPTGLDLSSQKETLERLEKVKFREFEGMYKLDNGKVSFWRWLLRMEGRQYEAWTTDNIVLSDCYDEVEWLAFRAVFDHVQKTNFYSSPAGLQHLKEEEEAAEQNHLVLLDLYKDFRYRNIIHWTKDFIRIEAKISERALEFANFFLEQECELLAQDGADKEVDHATFLVMHEEQKVHENAELMADDMTYWTMENILDDVYDHFARTVVDKMWEDSESRKTLLEFAGYLHKKPKSRLLINMKAKNHSHDWFNEFVNNAIADEKMGLALDSDSAALIIQRHWRGVLGRNKARKVFVKVFAKTYDPSSGAYYYSNLNAGTSSWERPAFMVHLFPKTSW
mmetsp:Transcript_10058/g.15233  ORF Transcript_10058/g.15233 Transcript_10058/m.15233 type:complete len:1075 (+) Transcript_10058:284-3508(+)